MHGYGEFFWKDGKKYAGYYEKDKKEGFGIYLWTVPEKRVYIGFWKNGKQEGVGKYINNKTVRYGLWSRGERTKWYESDQEALDSIHKNQRKYMCYMKYDLHDLSLYMS
jgi:hypothetical protein